MMFLQCSGEPSTGNTCTMAGHMGWSGRFVYNSLYGVHPDLSHFDPPSEPPLEVCKVLSTMINDQYSLTTRRCSPGLLINFDCQLVQGVRWVLRSVSVNFLEKNQRSGHLGGHPLHRLLTKMISKNLLCFSCNFVRSNQLRPFKNYARLFSHSRKLIDVSGCVFIGNLFLKSADISKVSQVTPVSISSWGIVASVCRCVIVSFPCKWKLYADYIRFNHYGGKSYGEFYGLFALNPA